MRRWLFAIGLLVSLLALAACAAKEKATPTPPTPGAEVKPAWEQEWERVLAAAKREGKVTTVGPTGEPGRRVLTEPFERKYGISVEYLTAQGPEFVPRLRAEREAGQYLWDVFVGGQTVPFDFKALSALDPLEPALITPEVKDGKNWVRGQLPFIDKDHTALTMSRNMSMLWFINTSLVKPEEFKSFRDLLDPKWKGKILAFDPRISGAGRSQFAFYYLHKDLGPDFVRALLRQDITISRDYRQAAEWLAQGRFPILLGGDRLAVTPLAKEGLPVIQIDPRQIKEGGPVYAGWGSVALFNKAPHPNAAKVYLNWLLSKEGQTEFSRVFEYASWRADVPMDDLSPGLRPQESYFAPYGEAEITEYIKAQATATNIAKEILGE
ncbi:MAG TPA: extracellular solute-binding protein [Dehalococcoidia bacterium]|nr:extracellular solute-binding protein [Dehalococcoidia bacterium]